MARYIFAADLHIRSNRPHLRKDDYFLTVIGKFRQILKHCRDKKAILIVAGDFFDSTKVGIKVVNAVMKLMRTAKVECRVVLGQHDMNFHTMDFSGSPVQTLVHAGLVKVLTKNLEGMCGCSFGEEPNDPEHHPDNILVIHKSITPGTPPFYLPDALSSEDMIEKYMGYQIIVSGDYHQPFVAKKWNRVLINCGPMMRENIDQVDQKPRVYFVDTEENTILPLFLRIKPASEVFSLDMAKKAEESRFSEELGEFVTLLKSNKNKPNFFDTVKLVMKEIDYPKETLNKVNEIINGARHDG